MERSDRADCVALFCGFGLLKQSAIVAVVDDELSVRLSLSSLLRSLNFRVFDFSSAEDFIHSSHYRNIDCLISDVQLPGMDGIELFEVMNSDGVATPVVFMSAFVREDDMSKLIGLGAVCCLKKPFAEEALLRCLSRAIHD